MNKKITLLYICTHNRCRSILCEAITNHISDGTIQAFSAGSQPVEQVHPLTIQYLRECAVPTTGLKSQSWDDIDIGEPDIVITVCDSAAAESCPVWLGNAIRVHWGLPDPSKLEKLTEEKSRKAFFDVINTIRQRVHQLLSLKLAKMTESERQIAIDKIIEES